MQSKPSGIPLRRHILLGLLLVVPLGFACKYALPSPLRDWGHSYGAAMLYEVFWILLVALVWPATSPRACAAWVLATTCALEFTQRLQIEWLTAVRTTRVGSWFLGTTFDPTDFAWYLAGCLVGWWLLRRLSRKADGGVRGAE